MISQLEFAFEKDQKQAVELEAKEVFRTLIQKGQYVGEVYSISYEKALVQIHDRHRQDVGGIPSLSFLIATRIDPEQKIDYTQEDASIILFRVMDAASLPNDAEAERIRVEAARKASGENINWDSADIMDGSTHNLLSFAGVDCRVIGTFFLDKALNLQGKSLTLRFGSDISNYYPNRGLKVYKPNDSALSAIVNYHDINRKQEQQTTETVKIGCVRYASTNRSFQGVSNVDVKILPADMFGQKTALFGMTRTGKSNTTKIILQSVFDLRFSTEKPLRIGQIIFDPNGEYANENEQDADSNRNPSAIKNVWQSNDAGKREDVVTYGILPHPEDPQRTLMLLNFFEDDNLQIGKEILDASLATDNSKYIQNFRQIIFEQPDPNDRSAMTRYNRRVLVYRALLAKAGFKPPKTIQPRIDRLFNRELIEALHNVSPDVVNSNYYHVAARILGNANPQWGELARAFQYLHEFIEDRNSGYQDFDNWYISRRGASGDPWADEDLNKLLKMFHYPNGARQVGKVRNQHTDSTTDDYAREIYEHLKQGKLVIIDQSSGDPEINQSSAERIMWQIFQLNKNLFRQGKKEIPEIIVYIEEAHNLLPAGSDEDLKNVWVRTAKEGAKYHIGMVYTTQEVSSIQRNILKNTANWLIGHLNNTDETKELRKYYDFADFELSIRRAQDRGFLRVKTLSNLFVVPVQVKKFEV